MDAQTMSKSEELAMKESKTSGMKEAERVLGKFVDENGNEVRAELC
jgi:hypothetical protein